MRNKISTDTFYLSIYIPKETTRKLVEYKNEFSKVAGYKTNTLYLYR